MNCPLCESDKVDIIEEIDNIKLKQLYSKLTGVNFSYLLNNKIEYCSCLNCDLKFFNPLITGDEKFYNALQKFPWYYMGDKEEFHYAKTLISEGDKVLEVGSGAGLFAQYIPTKDYTGLDFSQKAIELAKENGVHIENESIESFSTLNRNTYDIVVSFQVLEHVSNPKEFLEAQIETLKVGGKLIVAIPNNDSYLKYMSNDALNMPPHHVTRWNENVFRIFADKQNLKILNISKIKLSTQHKTLYLKTLLQNSILKPSLIDLSYRRIIIRILSEIIARFLAKGLKDNMLPDGHTMVVVMEKN